jgi:hypothetical protein
VLVFFNEAEFIRKKISANWIGALPSSLFEFYGHDSAILEDRMIQSSGIWTSGIHPVTADRTIHRCTSLADRNFYRGWRRFSYDSFDVFIFEAKKIYDIISHI